MSRSVTVAIEQWIEADVDIPLSEISDEDLKEELADRGILHLGPENAEKYIEAAYTDALSLGKAVPKSLRDLLWHVHGKAIA
jgi:hypothetical protein